MLLFRIFFSSFFLLLFFPSCRGQKAEQDRESVGGDTVRLLFAGDIMFHLPQVEAARTKGNQFDFDAPFDALKPLLQEADLTIGNLETTLHPSLFRGYPCFSSPDTVAYTLKRVGFDVLTTANNHAADRREDGIKRTLEQLNKVGILTTGSFLNREDRAQRAPLLVHCKGIDIAFLAYTYGTNGISVRPPFEVALLDSVQIRKEIAEARHKGAEVVIVLPHWGQEYQRVPNREQRLWALRFRRWGADAVVGSHPHVTQPLVVDTLHNLDRRISLFPVFYSLGNLISNQYQPYTQYGALAHIVLVKDATGVRLVHCAQEYTFCFRKAKRSNRYLVVPLSCEKKWLKDLNSSERYRLSPVTDSVRGN
jgi:poly-gamma-glutamate synthesis protein (capsule biosynthesis protein)